MRRRDFLRAFGAAVLVPSDARAQDAKPLPRVAFQLPGGASTHGQYVQMFLRGLRDLGFEADRHFRLELRYAQGLADQMAAQISELVESKVAVLVVGSTGAGIAAKKATSSIPVVFAVSDDPVRLGLVSSVQHPGGNVTGVSLFANELIGKQFQILLEMVPTVTKVGLLVNGTSASIGNLTASTHAAAQQAKRQLHVVEVSNESELALASTGFSSNGVDALIVPSDPFLNAQRHQIVALAESHKIPAIYSLRDFATGGGLASYGVNFGESYRQSGTQAGRILKGEKPADLPVLQPTKFELVINVKTARAFGLTVPLTLQASADEVVE